MTITKQNKQICAAEAAISYLLAKIEAENALEEKRRHEKAFIDACGREGIESINIFNAKAELNAKVYIRRSFRKTYNFAKLQKLLKPSQMKKIVQSVVDADLLNNAIRLGHIKQQTADRATAVKEVISVCISQPLTKEAE